jgi:hypothetical protein
MDKTLKLTFFALVALFGGSFLVSADTGHEGAARIERGSYNDVRKVTLSSTTGTALWDASVKRPDSVCYNNSASTVWIGTVSASEFTLAHPNIAEGFPIVSSGTFSFDGSHTGAVYATSEAAAAEMRCFDGLVR